MVKIGRINKLTIKRRLDYGAHLDGGESGDILLPKKYVPEKCQSGDEVEVFVYVDREERLRATTQKPYATVGQFAKLRVVANSSSGAYLDWGLQKDLLVPKREQHAKMEEGRSYVVFVFLDKKTNRVTASSKLDKFLDLQSPIYDEGEEVDLFICNKTDLGYKTIFDQKGRLWKKYYPVHFWRPEKGTYDWYSNIMIDMLNKHWSGMNFGPVDHDEALPDNLFDLGSLLRRAK